MNRNSLLSMHDLTKEEIMHILDDALLFENKYADWQLPCKKALVANLFFESSTRTHYSFASAEHQIGCKVSDFNASTSSITKGESLYDTVKTFESIGYDAVVIRNKKNNYFDELETISIPILNAGDGTGNHPTQCLLDLLTMYQEFGTLEGLNVLICGDVLHSRVAASNKEALEMFGSKVRFCAPKIWWRKGYDFVDFDEAIEEADVVMMLRVQWERGADLSFMKEGEFLEQYGLSKARYEKLKDRAIVMHPAPVNRGIEIDSDLVEAPKSRIFKQMENGVLVRKAVLKRAFGIENFEENA